MKTMHELMALVHSEIVGTPIPPIVLVVDDDDDTLQLYDALFSGHGYWVARAESGLQAFESAQDLQPDAIVTDIGLPGEMDGLDLIRELRADEKLRIVPVLAVTGRMPCDLASFAGLPISALLLKPVAPETLVKKVASMLRAPDLPAVNAAGTPATLGDQRVPAAGTSKTSSETAPSSTRATREAKIDKVRRVCPQCGTRLKWVETRRWRGVTYDYYHECTSGCGLSWFNRTSRAFETLLSAGHAPRDV